MSLLTTPIKGFAIGSSERLRLTRNGAVGDRDFFVVDERRRLISITRTGVFASWRASFDAEAEVLTLTSLDGRVLQDEVVAGDELTTDFWDSREVAGHVVDGPWSGWLSDIAGKPVDLVRADDGNAFDETPVTLLSEESVAQLARDADTDADIDIRRFRMLINISGVAPFEEETWRPRRVRVGTALLEMQGPVPRCNATTRDPDTGKRDLQTLRLIDRARGMLPNDFGEGLNLGAYALVVEPGEVSVGDTVEQMSG